jgi:ABC-2 type transport system ATP-binding protein
MITVKSLHKSFGKNEVLKNINLQFKAGEINGVVGENGAGKTTLFNCIGGFENYDGTISYINGNIKNVTGFLATDPYFLGKITGLEYLKLMCNARDIKLYNPQEKNIFDLPLDRYAENYSTGMKKKLALTATLLQRNEIFILDEPFNGVDIQSNIIIKELLIKLKELDKIVILSSHIFSTLNETCDYLHHLKDGEIINSVGKEKFNLIEKNMISSTVENRIEKLNLK